ncbi:MAG: hypothetical protein Q9M75_03510 [Ghiorsea sp.]|nr:hypothetical protein [Ghiorsea sp.]MDQ6980552.1 hypothetical protein [Ghiorsea sp.]MDQ7057398.1 hypothetical protein [Ghiorsea sp.]
MAIPVSPSNGFITRLLQQATQHTSNASNTAPQPSPQKDSTLISDEARQANKNTSQQLENKLIELYNHKGLEQS